MMTDTVGQLKRKRIKVACEPCRQRKRRCNGDSPCITCNNWGYDCYYDVQSQPIPHNITQQSSSTGISSDPMVLTTSPAHDVSSSQANVSSDSPDLVRCLEANSGAAFVRKIGLKIDPANAPKLGLFGWNIGSRQLLYGSKPGTALPIVNIASERDIKELADVYFAKVDPCYGFIDRHAFYERLEARWRMPLGDNLYDSVLSGVAALGSLFSQRNSTVIELHLVESARSILDLHQISEAPSVDLVTGWALRVIYMRATASPHPTWIASSILMHLIEASGLHLEPSSDTVFPRSSQCDPDIQRRLVGVAQHLNMWTSFDLGLSKVSLQSILSLPPSPKSGDYTTELLNLLPASASLDPGRAGDAKDLESSLSQILSGTHTQPPSVLAQCNLVLCILRRLSTPSFNISSALMERVLTLLKHSLHSARSLVRDCCPWHHVANVPFHIICILLVMDTRASLALLPDAIQTLELVASIYDTDAMKLAYSTAQLLVLLYQQRRSEDIKIFNDVLHIQDQQGEMRTPLQQLDPTSEEFSWLEGLVADMPGLQNFDMEQFLQADISSAVQSTDVLVPIDTV